MIPILPPRLPEQNAPSMEAPQHALRARALLIGAGGAVVTAVLVTQAEMVLSSLRIGYLQFPPVALGILLLSVGISRAIGRVKTRWSLSSSELLVIYVMALVAAMVSSHGVVQKFIPLLVAAKYGANTTNHWHETFDPFIQKRLVPYDPTNGNKQDVVEDYFRGLGRGGVIPWQPWVVPIANWGVLIVLVVFAFLCLTSILRRQWADNERLAFPLAQLPLEIASDNGGSSGFFSNRLMWLGALIPVVVYSVKALHQAIPSVPDIPLSLAINDYLTTPPWNRLTYTACILSFAAVGFFFLLPADILFSIWFFFLLSRLEQLAAIAYNIDTPGMPLYPPPLFVGYQTIGAYLVLAGYFVWMARPHLRRVWAAAIGREPADDAQELLPSRIAVWGLFGSIVVSALWLWGMGMSPWLALFELAVFIFVIALVMARSTAEGGMIMTETTFRPVDILRMVVPLHALGPANLTMLAFFDNLFLRDQRGLLLTGMLDSLRIADGTRVRRRTFVGVIALGIGIALVCAIGLNIFLPYTMSAVKMDGWLEQGSPQLTFNDYAPAFQAGAEAQSASSWQRPCFFVVGIVVTLFLTFMRSAFFWWPLHPLGYALSGSWSTVEFWMPCLIAWLFKSLVLRYGGMALYAKARPFFLGLVLGEFGIAVIFALLNALTAWLTPQAKFPVPAFPWG